MKQMNLHRGLIFIHLNERYAQYFYELTKPGYDAKKINNYMWKIKVTLLRNII